MDDTELRALLAAQAAQISALVAALRPPSQPAITVREIYRQREISQKHRPGWVTDAHMLRPIIKQLGDRPAASLLVSDWTAYRVSRDDLKPSSLNLALRCLAAMLRWGKREGLLTIVPQLCEARKQKQKAHRETAPTEREIGLVLDEIESSKGRVIILCACDSGMRNTEIRLLEWSWIDRARLEIRLPAAITKSRRARTIPITERQLRAIEAIPRDIKSPLVLRSTRTGGAYTKNWISRLAREYIEASGIQAAAGEIRVHLHDLRHAYATNAAERGVRIEVLSEILGHASLEQTRAYVQRRPSDLVAARIAFEAGIKADQRAF